MSTYCKEDKNLQRRDQIVAAARDCFRQSGFHRASMAAIADRAGISVGQIYRYFASKDDMIEAIVRQIAESRLQQASDAQNPMRLPPLLARREPPGRHERDDDHILMLEITAEATRNPRVAQILHDADTRLFQRSAALLAQRYPQLSASEAAARVELLAVLCDGSAFRSVIPPQITADKLQPLYDCLFSLMFPEENS